MLCTGCPGVSLTRSSFISISKPFTYRDKGCLLSEPNLEVEPRSDNNLSSHLGRGCCCRELILLTQEQLGQGDSHITHKDTFPKLHSHYIHMVQIDLKPWGIFQVSLSFVFLRNVSNSKCCTIAPSKKKKRKKSRPLTHSFVHCLLSMHPFCSMHCSRFWRWSRKWYRLCLHRYFFLFPKGERRMGHNEAWLSRCSFFFFFSFCKVGAVFSEEVG